MNDYDKGQAMDTLGQQLGVTFGHSISVGQVIVSVVLEW